MLHYIFEMLPKKSLQNHKIMLILKAKGENIVGRSPAMSPPPLKKKKAKNCWDEQETTVISVCYHHGMCCHRKETDCNGHVNIVVVTGLILEAGQ